MLSYSMDDWIGMLSGRILYKEVYRACGESLICRSGHTYSAGKIGLIPQLTGNKHSYISAENRQFCGA